MSKTKGEIAVWAGRYDAIAFFAAFQGTGNGDGFNLRHEIGLAATCYMILELFRQGWSRGGSMRKCIGQDATFILSFFFFIFFWPKKRKVKGESYDCLRVLSLGGP